MFGGFFFAALDSTKSGGSKAGNPGISLSMTNDKTLLPLSLCGKQQLLFSWFPEKLCVSQKLMSDYLTGQIGADEVSADRVLG